MYNYKKLDNNDTINPSNLTLVRKFEGSSDEIGFAIIHISMNAYSGDLVKFQSGIVKSI